MPAENISPEQKAKYMMGNIDNNITTIELRPRNKLKKLLPILIGLIVVGGLAYLGFQYYSNNGERSLLSPLALIGDKEGTKNGYANPINGEIVSEELAAEWKDERPIGVMMNNHLSSRPQSGLIDADIVYEIVAEGGITRFLAFFLGTLPEKIGTVRSTREYYLVLVKELSDAMIMHIGWSPQALEAIETWPVRSLGRGGAQFWRDQARLDAGIPTEHTAYVNGKELRALGHELGWQGTRPLESWKFKEDGPIDKSQTCLVAECDKPLVINFWYDGDYTGAFKYDRVTNTYLRFSGYDENGKLAALIDPEKDKQVAAKNVIVQYVTENSVVGDEKNRLDYQLVGSGAAVVFLDGKSINATWRKESRDGRTKFFDTNGQEILFNRGKIWVSIVPDRNIELVTY